MLVNCIECGYPAYFSTTAVQRGDAAACDKCGVSFRADATGRAIRIAVEAVRPPVALQPAAAEGVEAEAAAVEPAALQPAAAEGVEAEPAAVEPAALQAAAAERDGVGFGADEPVITAAPAGEPIPIPTPATPAPAVVTRTEPASGAQPAVQALPPELGVPDGCPSVAIDVVYSMPGEGADRLCRTARLDETFVLLTTSDPVPRILPGGSFVLETGPIAVELRPDARFIDSAGLVPARYAAVEPGAQDLIDELLSAARKHGGWWVACPTCARGQPVAQGTLEGQLVLTTCPCGTTAAVGPQGVIVDLDACPTCGAADAASIVRRAAGHASMRCTECGTQLRKDVHGRVIARPKGEEKPSDGTPLRADGCPTCGRTSEVLYLKGATEGTQTPCLGCGTILAHEEGQIVALVPTSESVEPEVLAALGLVESVPRAEAGRKNEAREAAERLAAARAAADQAMQEEMTAKIAAAEAAAAERAAEARAAAERAAAEKVAAEKAAAEKAVAEAVAAAKLAAEHAAAQRAAAEQAAALKVAAEEEARKAVDARRAAESAAQLAITEADVQRLQAEASIREAAAAQAAARKAADEAKAIKEEAERAMAEAVARRAKIERDAAERAAAAEAAATVAATEATAARQATERLAAEQEAVRRVTAEQTAVIQAAVEHVAAQTALGRVTQRLDPVTGASSSYHIVPVSPAGEHSYADATGSIVAPKSSAAGWLVAIIIGLVLGVLGGVFARGGLPVKSAAIEKLERANRLVRRGDPAAAIPLYLRVIEEAPEIDIAHRHLGVAYSLTGDFERARHAYEAYVERASDRSDADAVQGLLDGSE